MSNKNSAINFSSGPAMMFPEVMHSVREEFNNTLGTGLSVLEISHRSDEFQHILNSAKTHLFELLNLRSNEYSILFLTGGASTQFALLPMNFSSTNESVEYVCSGYWSKKAIEQAQKMKRRVHICGDNQSSHFTQPITSIQSKPSLYTHFVLNETIDGFEWFDFPNTKNPLVADVSSNILSRPIPAQSLDMFYAGCQKNIAPAGMTLVVIKNTFLEKSKTELPDMFSYSDQVKKNSLHNTPPVFSIYFANKVFEHVLKLGGLTAMEARNTKKAETFYHYLDHQEFYSNPVHPMHRSKTNVPFYMNDKKLENAFLEDANKAGLKNLKGHRSKGGLRASFYNAMPLSGVETLIDFMDQFKQKHG